VIPPNEATQGQSWSADVYEHNARFVSDLGNIIVQWLAVEPDERVLDLGCGDGVLTQELVAAGAEVLGIDASEDMLASARERGLNVELMDGHALTFDNEFDAVFSNAALHWMWQPEKVIAGAFHALRPGGRFVAEMGGFGNVAAIDAVLRAVGLGAVGNKVQNTHLCYFPTPNAYSALLEQAGFKIERMELAPRQTPLPTGLEGWLETFRQPFFDQFDEDTREKVLQQVLAALKPDLCDENGLWWADYVRLRFIAIKP